MKHSARHHIPPPTAVAPALAAHCLDDDADQDDAGRYKAPGCSVEYVGAGTRQSARSAVQGAGSGRRCVATRTTLSPARLRRTRAMASLRRGFSVSSILIPFVALCYFVCS